jgi:hypothetical protein
MAKVWKLPSVKKAEPAKPEVFYTLYERKDGKYIRKSTRAYPAKVACRVFAASIASAPLSLSLRPAKLTLNEAQSRMSRFRTAVKLVDQRTYGI